MRCQTTPSTPTGPPVGVESSGRWRGRTWMCALLASWLLLVLLRHLVLDLFAVPSASMQPTLQPGDRIVVTRLDDRVRRGDVVVFDGGASFGATDRRPLPQQVLGAALGETPGQHLVKRVVGVGGDHVRCCDDTGRLEVDGSPLDEPYLEPTDTPSAVRFDVRVPRGTLWVMGDHRSRSADSRSRLGAPGGGFVPERDVVGRVTHVIWPPARWGAHPQNRTPGGDR